MKVRLSGRAQRDLQSIFAYLSGESQEAAVRVLDRLETAGLELGDRSKLYPLVPRHEGTGFRRRVIGSYNLYYIMENDTVEIVAVLHSARNVDQILFPED